MSFSPTPIESFPDGHPYHSLVLKREDFADTGSHKFRYLYPRLKALSDQGITQAVLSTTGNAGITATQIGKDLGIKIFCLMSERGDLDKAAEIERLGGFLVLSSRPVRFAKYLAKRYQAPLLLATSDDSAVEGYQSLGEELIMQCPDAQAIVNFCTSGTSSLGLLQAYERRGIPLPSLHLVQSGKSCSVVKALHPDQVPASEVEEGVGLADTPHRERLLELIHKSGGDAHYVTQNDQQKAAEQLRQEHIFTSSEGLCTFWAGTQLIPKYDQIVVILTGKAWPSGRLQQERKGESLEDFDALWALFSEQT